MKVFIDLGCGLGGASEAFIQDPKWLVIRIDNNPDLKPLVAGLIVADVTDIPATLGIIQATLTMHGISLDDCTLVIWASPPCDEFSYAYNSKRSIASRQEEDYEPSLEIMQACKHIIETLLPDYWYIENVRGAINDFRNDLGEWTQQVGSFFLWGKHPMIAFKDNETRYLKKLDVRHSEMRAQLRAKVPLEISQAIKDSIDLQRTLTSFCVGDEQDA